MDPGKDWQATLEKLQSLEKLDSQEIQKDI